MNPSSVRSWRATAVGFLASAAAACSPVTEHAEYPRTARIAFTKAACENDSLVAPPFISVADSIDVFVRSSAGTVLDSAGRRLQRYQREDTLSITVPEGSSIFSARVLSSNRLVLFSGQADATTVNNDLEVAIPVCPERPVMLVAADTARPVFGGDTITGTFTIYNRGSASLAWSVLTVDPAFTACGSGCGFTPKGGNVSVGSAQAFRVSIPSTPPFTRRLFSFVLRSTEGDLPIVWEVTSEPVLGLTIVPNPGLVQLGQTTPFTANVQVSGSNVSQTVTWQPTGSNVVTVAPDGVARGQFVGITNVVATSAVDKTKSASAPVRVYSPPPPTDTSFLWTTPSASIVVSREDASPGTHSITVQARVSRPSGTVQNPFSAGVEFWARAAQAGPWRRIGTTNAPTLTDNGVNRWWTFSITWNPDSNDAPFANPSVTPMQLIAIGIPVSGGFSSSATQVNANVTVRVP